MSARKRQRPINLMPQNEFEASTAGRILKWILTTFRFIVIVVELVVIVGFLSRFFLDVKNSDLNEEIEQKQALILSYASFEEEYRSAQEKLDIFSELTRENSQFSRIILEGINRLPADIQLISFSVTDTGAEIVGSTASEQSTAQYIANLSSISQFSGVSLSRIESKADSLFFDFTINAAFEIIDNLEGSEGEG